MNGIVCNVYRPDYEASFYGITSEYNRVFLWWGDDIPPSLMEGYPVLEVRIFRQDYLFCEPAMSDYRAGMFGGTFAWTSDSRFREKFRSPIPIHDRFEISCRLKTS